MSVHFNSITPDFFHQGECRVITSTETSASEALVSQDINADIFVSRSAPVDSTLLRRLHTSHSWFRWKPVPLGELAEESESGGGATESPATICVKSASLQRRTEAPLRTSLLRSNYPRTEPSTRGRSATFLHFHIPHECPVYRKKPPLNLYYSKSCSSLWSIFVLWWAWHVSVIAAINCTALCKGCICCIYLSISFFFGCLFYLGRCTTDAHPAYMRDNQSRKPIQSFWGRWLGAKHLFLLPFMNHVCRFRLNTLSNHLFWKLNVFYGFTVRHRGLTSAVTVETSFERFQEFNRIV